MKLSLFLILSLLIASCGFLKGNKAENGNNEGQESTANENTTEESVITLVPRSISIYGEASIVAGSCAKYTLKIKDQNGDEIAAPSNFLVGITAAPYAGPNPPKFYNSETCTQIAPHIQIAEGQSSGSVYLKHTEAGPVSLAAFFTGATSTGSLGVTVVAAAPSKIIFKSEAGKFSPVGIRKSLCTGLSLSLEDSYGNKKSPTAKTRLDLGGAGEGSFYEDGNCSISTSVAYIEANADNEITYIKNATLERLELTASSVGLAGAQLTAIIVDAGWVDPSFGSTGFSSTDFGANRDDRAQAVAVQADGKIIVAGFTARDGNFDFAVARYLKEGGIDTSFASGGYFAHDLGSNLDLAYAVDIHSDGSIFVGGTILDAAADFAVLKLKSDGSIDTTFGTGGVLKVDFSGAEDVIRSLKIASGGAHFVAGGSSRTAGKTRLALYKGICTTGAPDATFNADGNADGKILTSITDEDAINALALSEEGKIVVAGSAKIGIYNRFLIAIFTTAGALDASFNGDGTSILHLFDNHSVLYAVAIDSVGRLIVGGASRIGTREQFTLFRIKANGDFDEGFNAGYPLLAVFEEKASASVKALVVQPDRKIIAVGHTSKANNMNDIAIARLNEEGSLDESFGNEGLMTLDTGSHNEEAKAVAISGSSIIAVGHSNPKGSMADFLVSSFLK